jgi:hypothetical protein
MQLQVALADKCQPEEGIIQTGLAVMTACIRDLD